MRRKDYEITNKEKYIEIINHALYAHLGMCDVEKPYVIPIAFGYDTKHIYVHCANEGLKITLLKKNPHVCVTFDKLFSVKKGTTGPCSYSLYYQSVICFGKAIFVTSINEKKKALELIKQKYASEETGVMTDIQIDKVTIIRIDIEEMTGKTTKKE